MRTPIVGIRVNCFAVFPLRFVALALMTTVLHILHSVLARPAIYNVYNTTDSFAFMAKTLLRARTGGNDGFGQLSEFLKTLLFSLPAVTH